MIFIGGVFCILIEHALQLQVDAYEFLGGMPELLQDLTDAGVEMHAMSNYPIWYRHINSKLELDRCLHIECPLSFMFSALE